MSEFPFMSWWIRDYYADTSHLTCAQHGVYMMLLAIAWDQPNGPGIPDDMAWLKRACQARCSDMHGNRFNKLVVPILHEFFHRPTAEFAKTDPRWRQIRQFSEWEFLKKRQRTNQENAAKRWLRTNDPKDLARAMAMRPQSDRNATHTHTKSLNLPTTEPRASKALLKTDLSLEPESHSPPRRNGHASPTLPATTNGKGQNQ